MRGCVASGVPHTGNKTDLTSVETAQEGLLQTPGVGKRLMTTKECRLAVGEAAEAPGSRASVTGLLCQLGKVAHLCRSRGLQVLDPMLICLRHPPCLYVPVQR